jgi:hypothetical protein
MLEGFIDWVKGEQRLGTRSGLARDAISRPRSKKGGFA